MPLFYCEENTHFIMPWKEVISYIKYVKATVQWIRWSAKWNHFCRLQYMTLLQ